MENLKTMKNQLISLVQNQLTHTETVNTKELGEAIDMIKDLEETIYYCTITKAMEEKEHHKEEDYYKYYEERPIGMRDDMRISRDWDSSRRWDSSREGSNPKDGRSHITRRYYMESKEKHLDNATTMKELEHYLSELSSDIAEMIEGATPEEKILLQQKLTTLVNKIK